MKNILKILLGIAIGSYLTLNTIDKLFSSNSMNRIIRVYSEIQKAAIRSPNTPIHTDDVQTRISMQQWSYNHRPFRATVAGTNTSWVLRFDPYPLTRPRRIWLALAYWEFDPGILPSFEMMSDDMRVKITLPDGHTVYLDEKK